MADVLQHLVAGRVEPLSVALDSRDVHERVFRELTPPGYEYFAGHYRGEPYRCLKSYAVMIPADPRVGAPPQAVGWLMRELRTEIEAAVRALDASVLLLLEQRLRYVVALTCRVFEMFLRVHPYANGNGHAGRFIVWSLLGRFGHWPRSWPVEPRPADPPYTDLIEKYRNGDKLPLETFILATLIPRP